MSLLLALSASSFFLPTYIEQSINNGTVSQSLLAYGVKHNNKTALFFALSHEKVGSKKWLSLLKILAKTDGESAYKLALYFKAKQDSKQTLLWLKQGDRLHHAETTIELARFYFNQEEHPESALIKASTTLEAISATYKPTINKVILQLSIAIKQGDIRVVNNLLSKNAQLLFSSAKGKMILTQFQSFDVDDFYDDEVIKLIEQNKLDQQLPRIETEVKSNKVTVNSHCLASLQLFATNLKDLNKTKSIIEEFKSHSLSKKVCIPSVRYIPLSWLSCDNENLYTRQSTLKCDESNWHKIANTIESKFIGVVLPHTGSYANLGILYLNPEQSVNEFSHEVSHLLGFIDEYPLPARHEKCRASQQVPFSLNVAVLPRLYQGELKTLREKVLIQLPWRALIKETTPLFQKVQEIEGEENKIGKTKSTWQLGTPNSHRNEIGVFAVNTCDNSLQKNEINAYMPSVYNSHLKYFSVDLSNLYMSLLVNEPTRYQMPSFEYNIALSYFLKSDIAQAKYWLEKSARKETDIDRKNKIKQGLF